MPGEGEAPGNWGTWRPVDVVASKTQNKYYKNYYATTLL